MGGDEDRRQALATQIGLGEEAGGGRLMWDERTIRLREEVRNTGTLPEGVTEDEAEDLRLWPGSYEVRERAPGERLPFEYHCWESPKSGDAELWYRSHQEATVVRVYPRKR